MHVSLISSSLAHFFQSLLGRLLGFIGDVGVFCGAKDVRG